MSESESQFQPPLQTVDISEKEEDSDDLFSSAIDTKYQKRFLTEVVLLRHVNRRGGFVIHKPTSPDISSDPLQPDQQQGDRPAYLPKLHLSVEKGTLNSTRTPLEEEELEGRDVDLPKVEEEQRKEVDAEKDASGGQTMEISVTEAVRVGDGMGAYVAYRVETTTNIPVFKKTKFSVQRRFSDFLGLHEKLVEKYLRAGRIIPPAPEKSVIGMTKVKMSAGSGGSTGSAATAGAGTGNLSSGGGGEQGSSAEFVERRRASLERYLARTAAHPVLKVDPDFREFLEADVELPKATNTSALSGAGVMRLFNKVGETVNKMTYRMEESDPWFEEKGQQVETLDLHLRRLHLSVESLLIGRRELTAHTAAFAKSAAMLGNCEEHVSLSRALSQLADLQDKVESLHLEQANTDFSVLCELLKDYVALLGAIKEVFHERVKVYQNWQHSQLMLNKKREYKAKLDLSGKGQAGGSGAAAVAEIADWEAKVLRCQEEFNAVSKMIKKELEQFEVARVREFKAVMVHYLEQQVAHQQKQVKYWEAFLPEAKAIA